MSVFDFFKGHFGKHAAERNIDLEQLEDRTLFDAFPLIDLAISPQPTDQQHLAELFAVELPEASIEQARELVVVDANVDRYEQLLSDLKLQGNRFDVIVLDANRSGVEQLTELLQEYHSLDAIHVISHGQNAAIQLGSDWLTPELMAEHENSIASWGDALARGGDLLFYGCDLGGSAAGTRMVHELSRLTGADVAASDDVTGHASLQGDWELEIIVGSVETEIPFSESIQRSWRAQLAAPIQEFYVPLLESEIYEALEDIYTNGTVDTDIQTVIGITATRDNTIITYDHHEDGYELDIANPGQISTVVWGDGDASNGSAPGLVGDLINAGDVIILQNLVPASPGAVNYFDGSDRFVSDQLLAVSRAGWSPSPGTVLAGTVEVTDTNRWGSNYTIPIGEDTADVFAQYEYTGLYIMSQADGTVVDVDTDGDGMVDISQTLAQGATIHVDGGIQQGATVTASADIQVDLITGDRDSLVDSRWYQLRPRSDWSSAYLNPVGTTVSTDPARIVLYNPNATSIMVDVQTQSGTVSVNVAANDTATYLMPDPVAGEVSGAYVTSQGSEDFYAVMSMDSDAAHTAYDWGFSLLPESGLTSMVVAGWAPGTEDLSANGSPVWITATTATDLYVDFDGNPTTGTLTDPFDNQYDELRSINALESERIFDNVDNDNSGLRVYTVDGTLLAAAWGLDPDIGDAGLPYLDLGTVVLPFPVPVVTKTATLANDVSGNGLFDPGDTVEWTITIENNDSYDMTSVIIYDDLPANTTYVANSTTLNGGAVADDTVGATIVPLDESGLTMPDIGALGTSVVTFQTTLNMPLPTYSTVTNLVIVSSNLGDTGASTSLVVNLAPNLSVTKDDGGITSTAGGIVVYTINYENLGTNNATGVVLTETLPANATFDTANSSIGWTETMTGSGVYTLTVGALNVGATGTAIFAVTVNDPLPAGVTQLNNSVTISDDGANGTDSDPSDNLAGDGTPVTAAPNLFVTKDDGSSSTTAGSAITYTISYGNSGSQEATGVVLTETLPANSTFNMASSTAGWTETSPGVYQLVLGNLVGGATGTASFAVTVDDPLSAGADQLTNSISIADDGANGPDEDPTDNSDDDIDALIAAPDLYITKDDGQTVVQAGNLVVYTINYGNDGSQGATGVVITETLPPNSTFNAASSTVGWSETSPGVYEFNVGALASGGTGTVAFAVTVNDPQNAGVDQLVNNATIADDGSNGADEDPSDNSDNDIDTLTAAPDLFITKDDGQSVVQAGNVVIYTIAYGNDGSQGATGVVITEALPVGATFSAANSTLGWSEVTPGIYEFNVGAFASGGTGTVAFAVTVNDPQNAGVDQLVNSATIADDGSNGADEDPSDNSDNDIDTLTAAPDLFITKDDGQSVVQAGNVVIYTIAYGNDGSQGATGVVITEALPPNSTFNAASSTAGWSETSPGVYEFNVGALASGGTGTVAFAVTVNDPQNAGVDQLLNSVSIADDGTNGADEDLTDNSDDDIDALVAAPDLFITKDDGQTAVQAGNVVIYTINYGNDGSQDATGVVLSETLPVGATFNAANSTIGWTETAPGVYEFTVGALASGGSGSVSFALTVDDPQNAGVDQLVNRVSIADDGTNGTDEDLADNLDEDIDTLIAAPDLYITKDDAATVVTVGDFVSYSISYGNDGTQDATGVVITETLPIGAAFDAANSTIGWSETSPGVYEFNVGALAAGSSGSVTFSVTVDDPQNAGVHELINNVSIADDGTNGADEDPSDNLDQDIDTLTAAPDLYVTKDDGATVVTVGDLVIYTINYGNDGTQGATGVILTESLPAGASFNAANSTIGWSETSPGVYQFNVGALAAGGSGSVAFAVTVDNPLAAGIDDLVNNVSIADDGANGVDEDPTDNSDGDVDTLDATPDLFVAKDDGLVQVAAGDTVTYTINFGNEGTQGATGVVLTETLPPGAVFNAGGSTAGWMLTTPGTYVLNVGALAAGQVGSVTFSVIVDNPLAAGIDQLINNVAIADDGSNGVDSDPTDNTDDDIDTIIAGPNLFITKDDSDNLVTTGDLVVYSISYGNSGSQDATGVVITETLPVGATFSASNSTVGWTETSPGLFEFNVGNLNSGVSGSVNFAVTVNDPQDAGVHDLVNNASITDDGANGADEDPSDNSDVDIDTLDATPDLYVTKDDSQSVVMVDDIAIYTIQYGNDGNQGATGVVITETVPAGSMFNAANSSIGWIETSPGVYQFSVGNLAAGGSGTVTFAVLVDSPIAAGIHDLVNNVAITDDGTNGPDSDLGDNSDTDIDTIDAEPDLFVSKDDSQSVVTVGDLVIYSITYGNDGSQGATGVVLTETLPLGSSFSAANSTLGWTETSPGVYEFSIGNLASGFGGTVTFAVVVDNPVAAGIDQLINNVTIHDDGANGPDADLSDNSYTDLDTLDANPELVVTKDDGVTTVNAGDGVVYTINYSNTGTQGATGIVLTETLPAGVIFDAANSTIGWSETSPGVYEFNVGTLVGGGSGSVLFAVTVDNPLAAGIDQMTNSVSIADDGTNGVESTLVDNTDTDTDTVVAAPDLYITKSDGGASVTPGGLAIYTLSYGNDGSQDATGVRLFELLPANTTFNAANSTAGWSETFPGEYELFIGDLASGATGTVTFAVNVNSGIPSGVLAIENLAQILDDSTNGDDEDDEDNRGFDDTPLVTAPDVMVTKTDGGITASPGDTVVYTLTYANVGNVGTAGIVITETVPNGSTFNSAASTPGWTETSPGTGIYEFIVDTLAANESGTVLFAVDVDDPLAPGVNQLVNNASIVDDGMSGMDSNLGNNAATDNTPIVAGPDLFVLKDDGNSVVQAGDLLIYTINYGNNGTRGANNVVITETLPAGVSFNTANSTIGWAETFVGSGVYTINIGSLIVGQTGSVNFALTVDNPLAAGIDALVNQASITDDGTNGADENPADNSDDDTDTVQAVPNLFVSKDDGVTVVQARDSLVYTINYGNTGTQDATGVVLTETLPAGLTFNSASSTPGWTQTSPGVYTFSVGDLGAGVTGSIDFAVIVDDPIATGVNQLTNNATITDDGSNGADFDISDNSNSDTDTVIAAPDLWVLKDDGGVSTTPGGVVTYTINYGNDGTQGATNVVLTELLPANSSFNATASDNRWTETSPGVYELTLGALAAGDSGSVTFSVTVVSSIPGGVTALNNSVSIVDDGVNGPDEDPTDNSDTDDTPISSSIDLSITKDDGGITTTPNSVVSYTLNFANLGNVGAAGVVITETLPANSTFNAANSSLGWTETSPGVYEFNVGALAAGATGSVTFAVLVDDPLASGVTELDNSATIADDGNNGMDSNASNNSTTDNTPIIAAPDLYVVKDDSLGVVVAGDLVQYTIDYGNNGSRGATGVVITETLPAGATFDAANSSPGWTETSAGVYEFTVGSLLVGQNNSVIFAVRVDNPLAAGIELLVNNVSIADDGANGVDENPTDNSDEDTDTIQAAPNLFVTKDDAQSVVQVGDLLIYTINYGNLGTQHATGVTITETLPAGVAFDSANSTPGWAQISPGVYEFNLGDVDGGDVGTISFAVIVDDPLASGIAQLINNVSITDDGVSGGDTDLSDNSFSDTDTVNAAPDLWVLKDDAGVNTTPGGVVTYTIQYGNSGSQDAVGVVLTEMLPPNSSLNSAGSDIRWTETSPGVYELTLGALAAGDSGSVAFSVNVDSTLPSGVTALDNSVAIADDASNGPDEDPSNNNDTDSTPIISAVDLTITKSDGGITTTPGGSVAYTLTYQNLGNIDATGVTITESLPANSMFDAVNSSLGWTETFAGSGIYEFNVGALAAGGSGSVTFAVVVVDPLSAGVDRLTNTATIADDGNNGADANATNNSTTDDTPVVAAPDLFIVKDDSLSVVVAGDLLLYTINYGNGGSQGATGVIITETLPVGATFSAADSSIGWVETAPNSGVYQFALGSLASGQNGSVLFAIIVDDPLAAGIDQLVNNVSITDDGANGTDEDPTNNSDTDSDVVDASPNLFVAKDDGVTAVSTGASVVYTINYGNNGSQDASGVVLTETLPTGATFDATGSTTGWLETSPSSGVYEYAIGDLAVGQTGSIAFAVIVNNPLAAGIDQLVNNVTIADDGLNGPETDTTDNSSSDTDSVVAAPNLVVTKDDGGVNGTPSGTVTWNINFSNIGSQGATGVTITEILPTNTSFDTAASTTGWTETFAGSGVYTFSVGSLAAGGSGSIVFAVTVDATLPGGVNSITNTVSIADDGTNGGDEDPTDNDDADDTPIVSAPDLTISKSDGGVSTAANGVVIYTLTYSNIGNVDTSGVVITEQLPGGSSFDATNSTLGWVETSPGTYELVIGTLAAGQSGAATFAVTVNDPIVAGLEQLDNSASIVDDGTNGADANLLNNNTSDATPIVAAPDLYVMKDDGNVVVAAGDTLLYSITYGNRGSQTAAGVFLTETLPPGSMFDMTNSSAGWVETSPGSGVYQFDVGTLMVGDVRTVTFAITVDNPLDPTILQLLNSVSIADDGTSGADEDPSDNSDTDVDLFSTVVDLSVTKDDGRNVTVAGDTLIYTIQFTNSGSVTATGVVLTETLPPGTTFDAGNSDPAWIETSSGSGVYQLTVGSLAVGQAGSVTFAVTVADQWASGIGQLVNNVTIADDGTNGADLNLNDNSFDDVNVLDVAPNLYVTKDDGGVVVAANGSVVYTLIYGNNGEQDATGVVITEMLPPNSTFDPALSSAGWTETSSGSGIYEFNVGALAVGDNRSIFFAVIVNDPLPGGVNQINNVASITDDGSNGAETDVTDNSASDVTPIANGPDYQISKDDGLTDAQPGQTVTYTIIVTNVGDLTGTGVVVVDTYPLGIMETVVADLGGVVDPTTGSITWDIGSLAPGQVVTLTVTGRIVGTVAAGVENFTNEVEVSDDGTYGNDPTPNNNQDDDTDALLAAPDLSIVKTDNDAEAILGESLIYSLAYTNQGNQDATGVIITESLPPGTSFDAGNSSPGWIDVGGGNYQFNAGALAAGETRNLQFAVIVDDELLATQTVLNTTTIFDDGNNGTDPTPGNNQDTEQTPLSTGEITGNVFDDRNGNGLFDASDLPLAGVTINLEGQDIFGNTYSLVTTTNANGQYTFSDLATGVYRITQQQPAGFIDGQESTGSPGGIVSSNDEITINLNPSESAAANNFGEVAAPSVAIVSKRAFLSSRFSDGYADVPGSIDTASGNNPPAPSSYVESAVRNNDGTISRYTNQRSGSGRLRADDAEPGQVRPFSFGYWRTFLSRRTSKETD